MSELATVGWTDSHCHLQDHFELAAGPVDEQLRRSRAAGVATVICIGTDAATSRAAVELAAVGELGGVELYSSVGLHPHEATSGTGAIVELLDAVLDARRTNGPGRVVAIGECGLDYFYEHSARDLQRRAFVEQLDLAAAHDLTTVVHTRDAFEDTYELLADRPAHQRVVIHCFTGGPAEAERLLEMGCYLSFSGISTFKNADAVREALVRCPEDRILVETDAPFLAPVPHRGRPNEPAYVALVGDAAAALRGVEPAQLAAATTANARRAFALG